jgi:hypothetical protein
MADSLRANEVKLSNLRRREFIRGYQKGTGTLIFLT